MLQNWSLYYWITARDIKPTSLIKSLIIPPPGLAFLSHIEILFTPLLTNPVSKTLGDYNHPPIGELHLTSPDGPFICHKMFSLGSDHLLLFPPLVSTPCLCGSHHLPVLGAHFWLPLPFQVFLVGSSRTRSGSVSMKPSLIRLFSPHWSLLSPNLYSTWESMLRHLSSMCCSLLFAFWFVSVTAGLYLLQEAFYFFL